METGLEVTDAETLKCFLHFQGLGGGEGKPAVKMPLVLDIQLIKSRGFSLRTCWMATR